MRGAVVLVLVGALFVGACGGGDDNAADTDAPSTTAPRGEPTVIRTRVDIADKEQSEPIATGEVLAGSTLGGEPFCTGGTILDSHARPAVEPHGPIERTITCPDGTVTMGLEPDVSAPNDETQAATWTIVGGTDAFEGLRGSGKMESVYDTDVDSPTRETLTGTVTR